MKVFGYYQYFVPPIVNAVAKYIHILILKIMVNLSTPLYLPLLTNPYYRHSLMYCIKYLGKNIA